VGPGLYLVGNRLEIDCLELLEHFGYADTPENRERCLQEAMIAVRKRWPHARQRVITREGECLFVSRQ